MDIPCAILIAAFCLPDANYKVEVKSGLEGSDAIVAIGDVRAHILLTDDAEPGAPPTAMDKQLCYEEVCVAYTARVRPDASAVELLIAAQSGKERFIQLRGPLDQVAAIASRMTFVAEAPRNGWVQIPLSEFKVSEPQPAAAPDAEPPPEAPPEAIPTEPYPDPAPEPELGPPPEPPPQPLPGPPPDVDTAPLPDIAPVPELGPLPETAPQAPPEWPRPNRPY